MRLSDEFEEHLRFCQENIHGEALRLTNQTFPLLYDIFSYLLATDYFYRYAGLVQLNNYLIKRACISFWEDLVRVRGYHPIDYPDGHKLAAYMFKWINKLRPIEFIDLEKIPDDIENTLLHINGVYSIHCALSMPGLNIGEITCNEFENMLYTAMYRDIHADEWAMIFYLLEKLYPNISDLTPDQRLARMLSGDYSDYISKIHP